MSVVSVEERSTYESGHFSYDGDVVGMVQLEKQQQVSSALQSVHKWQGHCWIAWMFFLFYRFYHLTI